MLLAAGGGYALGAAGGDDAPRIKRHVVPGSTDQDTTGDKWVTAECPEGTTVVSGGAVVPHANDTPGVAVYWSAPYEDHGDQGWSQVRRSASTGSGGQRRRLAAAGASSLPADGLASAGNRRRRTAAQAFEAANGGWREGRAAEGGSGRRARTSWRRARRAGGSIVGDRRTT